MSDVKRIIFFSAGALGDVINLLPALAGLRNKWPAAEITGTGQVSWMELLKAGGVIDHVLSLDHPGLAALFSETAEPRPEIALLLKEHGLAISWIRNSALQRHLQNLGINTIAYSGPFPPRPGSGHVSRSMASVLSELGIGDCPLHPRLDPPAAHDISRRKVMGDAPEKSYIVIHPGSGSKKKNWDAARFAQIARRYYRRTSNRAIITFGPADQDAEKNFRDAADSPCFIALRDISPVELASVLFKARLVLANDSGVAHLAGSLGTPTLTVYGPTDPLVWGVLQPNARAIRSAAGCAPCDDETRGDCPSQICLEAIDVEQVWQELSPFLSQDPVIS